MKTIRTVLPAGQWDPARAVDRFAADHDGRHRRRMVMRTEAGAEILLDLAQAVHLRDGDGLELPDGGVVRVATLPEALLEITAASPAALMRLAWHIGNRHLPAAIEPDRILIRADHVIAEMIAGLGGRVAAISAPFDPETGAYAGHADPHHHHHDH